MARAILTRADGTPIERPSRRSFATDADFVRAMHRYNDEVTRTANAGFDAGFHSTLKEPRTMAKKTPKKPRKNEIPLDVLKERRRKLDRIITRRETVRR